MSTDPDIRREEQIAAEQEEDRGGWLADSLALLDSLNPELPWTDAGEPKISSEEERPADLPAAGEGTAA